MDSFIIIIFQILMYYSIVDGAVPCLMSILNKHAQWIAVTSLVTRTISSLVRNSNGIKTIKLFRKEGFCSASVQAVCFHYLGNERESEEEKGKRFEQEQDQGSGSGSGSGLKSELVNSSLLLLHDLLQTISDLIDTNRIDLGSTSIDQSELNMCRSSLIVEGAHEAVALVMRTHHISTITKTSTATAIIEGKSMEDNLSYTD